ncbi:hypothetical protein AJ87_17995 [Rhizobium yanglingense]|nr:hypothetical protein AJ87_17995 [Rhizobium yanglingense]
MSDIRHAPFAPEGRFRLGQNVGRKTSGIKTGRISPAIMFYRGPSKYLHKARPVCIRDFAERLRRS